jgi:hypothetical protein
MDRTSWMFAALVVCAGCASTPPGRHPSASQYDALAAQDDRAAKEDLTGAVVARRNGICGTAPNATTDTGWSKCATSDEAAWLFEAQRARDEADAFRARAQSMRAAEKRACAGLGDLDRQVSPMAHTRQIVRVDRLDAQGRLIGARVTFAKVPGLTRDRLQQLVDCHVAIADEMGHDDRAQTFDPLSAPDASAGVRESDAGFEVTVVTSNPTSASEILRRAQALHP